MSDEHPLGLIESLVSEQRERWHQGQRISAEIYLEQNPSLQVNPSFALELIYNEILLREEEGETPLLEEYLGRFPRLAAQLRPLFEVHQEFGRRHPPDAVGWTPPAPHVLARNWPAVDGYVIEGQLGVGGMGIVYRARQVRADRRVALKMIRTGDAGAAEAQARFRDEARKLARLSHPHIVPIYEVGEQDGQPFFSMELVGGGSLAARLQGTPLPPRAAAQLVELIARAMHFVHQAGIIHRDLKPANILLAGGPEVPVEQWVPKITDFGLAKRLDGEGVSTASGVLPGTPSYMAPEQIHGSSEEVSPLTDVYGLGAILYELLTGRPPFRGASIMDTLQQVRSREPVPPRSLQPAVPPDLQTICLKCLQKQPGKRYADAQTLAQDLQHFLEGRPILARPAGPMERLACWGRRNPLVALLLAAVLLSLLGGTATASWFWAQAVKEKTKAEQEAGRAQREADQAEEERRKTSRNWYAAEINLAEEDWRGGSLEVLRERLGRLVDKAPRDFEWHYLHRLSRLEPRILAGRDKSTPGSARRGVAFSPDGRLLAAPGPGEKMMIRDSVTGQVTHTFDSPAILAVSYRVVRHRPLLAAACNDRTVRVWDPETKAEVCCFRGHRGQVNSVALSPEGTLLASAAGDHTVKLWHLELRKEVHSFRHTGRVYSVAFSSEGDHLAAAADDGTIKVWTRNGASEWREQSFVGHQGPVWCVAFSPEGPYLASAGEDGTVRVWDSGPGKVPHILRGHTGAVHGVAFSPDGQRLVSASADGTVRVWDWKEASCSHLFRGHTGPVSGVAFGPEGRRVASASGWDQTVRVWNTTLSPDALVLGSQSRAVKSVAFSADGRYLASASTNPDTQAVPGPRSPARVTVWESATGVEILDLPGHTSVAFSADSLILAAASKGTTVTLWAMPGGQLIRTLDVGEGVVTGLAFSPTGKTLAAGSATGGKVLVWETETGKEILRLKGKRGRVLDLAFSADGQHLAASIGSSEGEVVVWDTRTAQVAHTFAIGRAQVNCLTFSPDSRHLAWASSDRTVKIRELAREEVMTLAWPDLDIRGLAYSPSGHRLATAGADGTVKVWDPVLGRVLLTLRGHRGAVNGVAFSSDGLRLASAGRDGTIRLRDATPPTPEILEQREAIGLVRFLFAGNLDRQKVLERIDADVTTSERVKQQARDLAKRYRQKDDG
jgi:WD40 repeat protein